MNIFSIHTLNLKFLDYSKKALILMSAVILAGAFTFSGLISKSPVLACFDKHYCGDSNLDHNEECDDGNIVDGDGCSSTCTTEVPEPYCGDGNLDQGEECDDGNNEDGDGCSSTCTIEEFCESYLKIDISYFANYNPPEATENLADMSDYVYVGSNTDPFGQTTVIIPLTTNNRTVAIVDPSGISTQDDIPGLHVKRGEDTNGLFVEISTYGFNYSKTRESIKAAIEFIDALTSQIQNGPGGGYESPSSDQCGITEGDPKNDQPGNDEYEITVGENTGTLCSITNVHRDRIRIYYQPAEECGIECGNSILDQGEECDDGNNEDGDGCSSTCTIEVPEPYCGDGNLDQGEECDDGNIVNGDGCSSTCTTEVPEPYCSDNNLDPGEQCDDGNIVDGDGCSSTCTIEEICESHLEINIDYFANYDPPEATSKLSDMSDYVYVGSDISPFGQTTVTIPLTTANRTVTIIDPSGSSMQDDVPGLHIKRGEDTGGSFVEISAYGFNYSNSRESIKGTIEFINALTSQVENGSGGGYESPFGNQCGITEGDPKNDQPGNDEYEIIVDGYAGIFCSITNVHRDRVKIYYQSAEECGVECGDSNLDQGEECDDGNTTSGDGCSATCTIETPEPLCGDNNVDPGEQCDDGNTTSGDGCSATCTIETPEPLCGDNNVDPGEQCDDGNTTSGDGCSATCTIEGGPQPYCGDSILDQGEECDDGNNEDGDGCSTNCVIEVPEPFCGDGNVDPEEECDGDIGLPNGYVCTESCTLVCDADLDVMMVIDASGSMGTENPTRLFQAQAAANSFIDNLRDSDQSGLVSFSWTANLDKALSNGHAFTQSIIDSLTASGATNIGEAIDTANNELISLNANPQAIKIEILLTDGRANQPNGDGSNENSADVALALAKSLEAADNNIIIFTIGLGNDINTSMLQGIADNTGGQYYFAPTSNDLDEIFNQIAFRACEYSSISGCKYRDLDNDINTTDDREPVSRWEIILNSAVNLTQFTDQQGCFSFSGLNSGTYSLYESVTQFLPYTQLSPINPTNYEIVLGHGENANDFDFVNYMPECGNNILDDGEQCDDGNNEDGDGCSSTCTIEVPELYCGDGNLDQGEECDDGNIVNGDGCSSVCLFERRPGPSFYCGDGYLQGNEECDDGNSKSGDGCSFNCKLEQGPNPYCGDGNLDPGEECDGDIGLLIGYTCAQNCILEKNVCNMDLDVVMVIDVSGSMGHESPTRLFQAQAAANNFIDNLRDNDQSGLASFSWTANLDKALSNEHTLTQSIINSLIAEGATNIGDAIDTANNELVSPNTNPQAVKIEILLTDGRANQPNGNGNNENSADVALALAKSLEAAEKNIIIFTIGLGNDINVTMLQNIADNTGGEYYFAPTSNDLDEIFNQIAFETCQYSPISYDKLPIRIFNQKTESISDSIVTVSWLTNIPATSRVVYGEQPVLSPGSPPNYGYTHSTLEINSIDKVIFHTVTISDLVLGNTYYWRAISHASLPEIIGDELMFITREIPREPECGNGILDVNEQCDDANTISGDGCSSICIIEEQPLLSPPDEPECGDGNLDQGEECDDGNIIDRDGCSAICEKEEFVQRPSYFDLFMANLSVLSANLFTSTGDTCTPPSENLYSCLQWWLILILAFYPLYKLFIAWQEKKANTWTSLSIKTKNTIEIISWLVLFLVLLTLAIYFFFIPYCCIGWWIILILILITFILWYIFSQRKR